MEEETLHGINPLAQSHEGDYQMMNSFLDFLSYSTEAAVSQHLVSAQLTAEEALSLGDPDFVPSAEKKLDELHDKLDLLDQETADTPSAGRGRGRGKKTKGPKPVVKQNKDFFFFFFLIFL